jgi:CubicO group peptidase (beta-lactamase class C family)
VPPDDVAAGCQAVLAAAQANGSLPSIRAIAFTAAGTVWEGVAGIPARQYRIGSITKTFTAVAILQLREAGVLDLDDTLGRHLPDAPYPESTLRDLLCHRSGVTAEPRGPWWERTPGVDWDTLTERNREPVQALPARLAHHYSNLGYALLGEVVARRRGESWYDAVRSRILQPLSLSDTTYHPELDPARGTSRDPRSGVLMQEPTHDSAAMAPAGQLWSTVGDLARWGSFIVNGRTDVLPRHVLREMHTVAAGEPQTQHHGAYGLGFRLIWRPKSTAVGHTGSMPGFLAALFTDAASGVGAAVVTNATTGLVPEEVAVALIDHVEPAIAGGDAVGEGVSAATPAGPAADLAGDWYWGNTPMSLQPTPDGFRLTSPHELRSFTAVSSNEYVGLDGYFAGERLAVVRRPDGSVSHLEVVTFILTRTPYDPDAPIPGGPPQPLVSSPD